VIKAHNDFLSLMPTDKAMQRTALRAAADAGRWADEQTAQ